MILELLSLYVQCDLIYDRYSTLSRNPTSPLPPTNTLNGLHNNRSRLLVVLPVIQGHQNLSEEKLQYFYTKPPDTLFVEDVTSSSRISRLTENRFRFEAEPTSSDVNRTMSTTSFRNEPLKLDDTSLKRNSSFHENASVSNLTKLEYSSTESTTEPEFSTKNDWDDLWNDEDIEFDLKSDSVDHFKLPSKEQIQQLLDSFGLLPKVTTSKNGSTRIERKIRADIDTQMSAMNTSREFRIVRNEPETINEIIVNTTETVKTEESTKFVSKNRTNETKIVKINGKTPSNMASRTKKHESRSKTFLSNLYKMFPIARSFTTSRVRTKSTKSKKVKKMSTPSTKTEVKRQEVNFTKWAHENDDSIEFRDDLWTEETSTTSPSTNGLYFMVDWNKFFNVGQPKENPVRMQYELKSGDPRQFMPIDMFNELPMGR